MYFLLNSETGHTQQNGESPLHHPITNVWAKRRIFRSCEIVWFVLRCLKDMAIISHIIKFLTYNAFTYIYYWQVLNSGGGLCLDKRLYLSRRELPEYPTVTNANVRWRRTVSTLTLFQTFVLFLQGLTWLSPSLLTRREQDLLAAAR